MMEQLGIIIGFVILAAMAGIWVYNYIKLDKVTKIANLKEWLKFAVVEAEKYLGGGTGQLKLRYVYDLAVKQFPWLITLVSFELFGMWVDEALTWMKQQIEQNVKIDDYVQNKE